MPSPTQVQSNSSGINSLSPTTVALGSAVTAGNLLIVKVVSNGAVSSFTDTGGNTFLVQSYSAGGWVHSIYYCLSARAGSESVTVTGGVSVAMVTIEEWSAGANASFTGIDGTIVGASGSSASMSAGPIITTNPTDVIVACGESGQPPTGPGAGFTRVGHIGFVGSEYGISEYEVVTSTGSYNVTGVPNLSATWTIAGLAFMAVANPIPPPPAPSGPPGAAGYVLGTPFITTLRLALLTIWAKWPYRLIQDYNGNLYTAQQLLNNQNAGTKALMQQMVQYMPENGAIVWVSQGIRQATLYTVTQQTRNPMFMVL